MISFFYFIGSHFLYFFKCNSNRVRKVIDQLKRKIVVAFFVLSFLFCSYVKGARASFDWDVYTHDEERTEECQEIVEEETLFNLEMPQCSKLKYQNGIQSFFLDILQKKIAESDRENQLVSPLGISFLLSMITHGMGLENQLEISQIAHLSEDENTLKGGAFDLINTMTLNGWEIAGLLYLHPKFRLNLGYQNLVSYYYRSKVESGSSASRVNDWVKEVTKGLVQKITDQSELNNFFLLLASAIHFKGEWNLEFKKSQIFSENFMTPVHNIQTAMMHKTDRIGYYEDDNCQAIRLPYKDSTSSMLLILPKKYNDFSFIDEPSFTLIRAGLRSKIVKIALPSFKLELEIDVRQILYEMGMTRLFKNPDFSGLVDLSHSASLAALPTLQITKMKQKSILICDEKGTRASSVTSTIARLTSAPRPSESDRQITFNRPFLAILLTEEIPVLFGLIRDPSIKDIPPDFP